MGSFISLLIIILGFIIFCAIFFFVAVSDAKVREKSTLEILKSLPKSITDKWVVRYNIGRPQGRFLKMKTFQGSGVLYIDQNEIHFEDVLGNESHVFQLNECKISWVENKINGITNSFKIVDQDRAMYFYVEKGISVVNSIEENASTSELYSYLKMLRKANKKQTKTIE
ncbi:MAG: hypothetical protein KIG88_06825 [Weeksellaceae bacterium]|nr:hypothetical protein [Weeksellaceae bacterium]